MLELFDSWVRLLGPWGYPALGLAALIEYVAPPFPGDTITLLGGAYAARGDRSYALVFLALMVGSAVGISANYGIGYLAGERVEKVPDGRMLFAISHAQIRKVQELMRKRGGWLLVVNRFLPSFRAVLFMAAGASKMDFKKVLGLGLISAAWWNATLLIVGASIGANAEALEQFLSRVHVAAFGLMGVAVLALLVRHFARRRKADAPSEN